MTIEIDKANQKALIESIQRYFAENMDEPIGNLAAGGLLTFILEEVGPIIYNQAVQDVQASLQKRLDDLPYEVSEEEYQYWRKHTPTR